MTAQSAYEKSKAWLDRSDPAAAQMTQQDIDRVAEQRRTQTMHDLARESVMREYRLAGIAPVYADPEHTMIVSLAMMLHNGWRIERADRLHAKRGLSKGDTEAHRHAISRRRERHNPRT